MRVHLQLRIQALMADDLRTSGEDRYTSNGPSPQFFIVLQLLHATGVTEACMYSVVQPFQYLIQSLHD